MSDTPHNPGAAAMAGAMEQARRSAEEFARLFANLKFPAVPDTEAVMASHRRNMEVLAEAGRLALDNAQAVARRHMEIMQQTITDLSEHMRSLSTHGAPQDKAAQQAELLKRAYDRAVDHARELASMIQSANSEALALLNKRFDEAMEEVRTLTARAGATPPAA